MIRAVLFLQVASFKNKLRQRLKRLRSPRYFFGAIAGVAYFYFFFLRHFFQFSGSRPVTPVVVSNLPVLLEPIAAFVLLIVVILCWVIPPRRASLVFTEAEVAFLFPAPVPRRHLINYKLLKSQVGILLTSLIISLLSRRWQFLGGGILTHAIGWWLIFSFGNLHSMAASFTCERLFEAGLQPKRRRLIASLLILAVATVSALWIRDHLPTLEEADLGDLHSLLRYLDRALDAPGLAWILLPFRLIVRPFLAPDLHGFLQASWPVLLIVIAQYVWVLRAEVAFEESSVTNSQKQAELVGALRAGDWPKPKVSTGSRRDPFPLPPRGTPVLAFFWSNLIALGPAYYARSWVITAVILIGAEFWLLSDPLYRPMVQMAALFAVIIGAYALLLGPLIVRRGSHRLVQRLDQMKAYPLRGSQVILGELLSPVVLVSAAEWLLLALLGIAASHGALRIKIEPSLAFTIAISTAVLLPPIIGLMFGLNFIGILYFPAWTPSANQAPGIERMGQGLIFLAAYVVVLIVCLAPAAVIGGVLFALTHILSGNVVLDIVVTSAASLAILCGELYAFVWWLGQRYESFDLSAELPR